ncbi:MAG: OmcA/MtrC family decaheme c-type cytochrome [Thermodesulfobacteriota bacterium]
MRRTTAFLFVLLLFAPALFLGCTGDTGPAGPAGAAGGTAGPGDLVPGFPAPPADNLTTASETCNVCHGVGARFLPMNEFHDAAVLDPVNTIVLNITGVTFPATPPVQPVVTFTITRNGAAFTGIAADATLRTRLSFGIAKLIPGANGDPDTWQSYITREASASTTNVPGGVNAITVPVGQATAASHGTNAVTGGTLVETGTAGTYTFTFNQPLDNAVTFPGSGVLVGYDNTLTHRVAVQTATTLVTEGDARVNDTLDVRPDGGAITVTRNVATTASCLECHTLSTVAPRWGFHSGGARVEVEYCVVCHNPNSIDPQSGETVDMGVMTHKIHRGKNLPTVLAGGSYIIWGNNNSVHDYSHVGYPQDVRNCTKCHNAADAATPDGNNWRERPSQNACGSCHDDISFAATPPAGKVQHSGGPIADNSSCVVCHPADGFGVGLSVTVAHQIPERVAAADFQFNVLSVTGTAPGQRPVVTFSVTNPNDNTAYDILTHPAFTVPGGASRLAVLIGWMTGEVGLGTPAADYTNKGSGNNVGQPVSINPLAAGVATNNGNGTFAVTSPVAIPADAIGTGIAALEGHPALTDGTRLPVRNAFLYFGITDVDPVPRRQVVTATGQPLKCDNCHDQLTIHGANRTDSIEVCVICHNPNATDIGRRPASPAVGIDGKREETIDFKNMIHAIHGSGVTHGGGGSPRTTALVVYGFGGNPADFGEVTYPGNMRRCSQCHEGTTWQLPMQPGILATTVNSPTSLTDPDDDGNMTKNAGVCSACHDSAPIRAHMVVNGAHFNVLQGNIIE